MVLSLFEENPTQSNTKAEFALREVNELLHQTIGWEVASFGNSTEHTSVQIVIFIEGVFTDLEEIIVNETIWLVCQECKADIAHVGESRWRVVNR